ncbi:DNA-binding response regulator [Betaproteobacteria bacterium]|nr:DNA-binding response regulator [Betaproteobacteria bacterium]GHU46561.1 DNA-binding response regulator [Betaproteobacteria bacterium]
MLKILIVEDHALVREALVRVLRALEADTQVREASSGDQMLDVLKQEHDFNLVLLDLALPGMDGFTGLKLLRQRYPDIPVVILSAFDDQPTISRVLNNGAAGFIPKSYSGDQLLNALSQVLSGHTFYPAGVISVAQLDNETPILMRRNSLNPTECGLTERQGEVLALMSKGRSNREIALQLGLSEGTVKLHVTAIFRSLGVNSRAQAIVMANRYGIKPAIR